MSYFIEKEPKSAFKHFCLGRSKSLGERVKSLSFGLQLKVSRTFNDTAYLQNPQLLI
jgi:hypothetical protein